jgi:CRP-like cAMP-binding protein
MAPVENALVRKLGSFVRLSPTELAILEQLQSHRRHIAKQTELVHEGQSGHRAFILQEGWASCYKILPDGGRQIITFSLPGDCMGLRSVLLRTSDHSFATITDAVVSDIPSTRIISLFHDQPRIGAAILWAASRDEAMTVEHREAQRHRWNGAFDPRIMGAPSARRHGDTDGVRLSTESKRLG